MNTRIASLIAMALILAPILSPLAATKAAAQSFTVEVVPAPYLNYNILLIKVEGVPSDHPLAVSVTPYDANGNALAREPYLLLAGYAGGNEWHVFIALNKTFEKRVFPWNYTNTSSTTIGTASKIYNMSELGINIYTAGSLADALSRVSPVIALEGKAVQNITNMQDTNGNKYNFTSANIASAWPIVNALSPSANTAYIEVKIEAGDLGSQTVRINIGPSKARLLTQGYLYTAPEKVVEFSVDDPTLLANPTAANTLTYVNSNANKVLTSNTSVQVFNLASDGTPAMKAAALEAGATNISSVNIIAQLYINTTNNWATLSLTANEVPQDATIFVELGIAAYNGTSWYNRSVFAVLTSDRSSFQIFNWTKVDPGNTNVIIKCVRVTIVPANVSTNINSFEGHTRYESDPNYKEINVTYTPEQYTFIREVYQEGSALTFKLYMPGRDDVPSYEFIAGTYAVNDAPVSISFTEGSGAGSGSFEVDAFIKLQTGALSIPSSVKPGEAFTITLTDIDAYSPSVDVALVDSSGNNIATATVQLEPTGTAGEFTASLKVMLPSSSGNAGIDTSNGVIYVNSSVAKIVVTYHDKYSVQGTPVDRSKTAALEFYPTTVSLPSTAGPLQAVTMKVISGNLNLNPSANETLYMKIAGDHAVLHYGSPNGITVAEIYVKKNGNTLNSTELNRVFVIKTFYETGADTGTYKIPLYLRNLDLKNNDKIEVDFKDTLNSRWYNSTIAIQAIEGKVKVYAVANGQEIAISKIPIAAAKGANVSITYTVEVKDSDANTDPAKVENATLYFYFLKYGQTSPASIQEVKLPETDIDTGDFKGTLSITFYSNGSVEITLGGKSITLQLSDLPYGKLVIMYNDTSVDKNVTVELPVKNPSTAELTLQPTVADKLSDSVTITLYEPDLDTIPGAGNDKLPSDLTFGVSFQGCTVATASITVADLESAAGASFNEVAEGKFQLTMPAQELLRLIASKLNVECSSLIGKAITLSYTDPVSAGSISGKVYTATTSGSFMVRSHTAELTVTPEKVSPFGTVKIVIYDPDLIGMNASYVRGYLAVSSGKTSDLKPYLSTVYPETGGSENGTFVFTLSLNDSLVNPVDTVIVSYTDLVDADGQQKVITKTASVVSENGTIEFTPEQPAPDSMLTIVVKDFDANKDPNAIDTVNVTVYSSAINVRKTITLIETGPNTGVFTYTVRLSSSPAEIGAPNTIYAPAGSTVYVVYHDEYGSNGKPVDIVNSTKVAAPTPKVRYPLIPYPEKAVLKDAATLENISVVKPGKQAVIVIPVENIADYDVTTYVIAVVYKDGAPVAYNYAINKVPAKSVVDVPATLPVLTEPGTYTVKILFWKDLVSMQPLSKSAVELTITVGR
ncbi:hypothetical protein CF15_08165 [Pyrodictium occultum]|uniref:Uncharacterized protein n=1 Tax=Pyrodictium occultum TaxID=2309 RepID=A0A0V8RS45_PYROC|nr:hypothetical protein [Pyrodictium occultum]KSW10746.1 hypothetical protein CF15_08165 [Pyrodictium occultum]